MSEDFGNVSPPEESYSDPMPPADDFGTPIAPEPEKSGNRTMWIIVAVVVILLCCCCVIFGGLGWFGWNYGDQFLYSLVPQLSALLF